MTTATLKRTLPRPDASHPKITFGIEKAFESIEKSLHPFKALGEQIKGLCTFKAFEDTQSTCNAFKIAPQLEKSLCSFNSSACFRAAEEIKKKFSLEEVASSMLFPSRLAIACESLNSMFAPIKALESSFGAFLSPASGLLPNRENFRRLLLPLQNELSRQDAPPFLREDMSFQGCIPEKASAASPNILPQQDGAKFKVLVREASQEVFMEQDFLGAFTRKKETSTPAEPQKPFLPFFNALELFYAEFQGTFWILLHNTAQEKFYPVHISNPQADSIQEDVCRAIMEEPQNTEIDNLLLFSKGCDALHIKKSLRKVFFAQPKGKQSYCVWKGAFQWLEEAEPEKCLLDEIIDIIKALICSSKSHSFPLEEYRKEGIKPKHSCTPLSFRSLLK